MIACELGQERGQETAKKSANREKTTRTRAEYRLTQDQYLDLLTAIICSAERSGYQTLPKKSNHPKFICDYAGKRAGVGLMYDEKTQILKADFYSPQTWHRTYARLTFEDDFQLKAKKQG